MQKNDRMLQTIDEKNTAQLFKDWSNQMTNITQDQGYTDPLPIYDLNEIRKAIENSFKPFNLNFIIVFIYIIILYQIYYDVKNKFR